MFKNYALMGEFGEYIYFNFCKKNSLNPKFIRMGETDVEIEYNGKKYLVDVKTTDLKQDKYKGSRHRENLCYDQVVVDIDNNSIKINPDIKSPLNRFGKIIISDLDINYEKWIKSEKPKKNSSNSMKIKRDEIKQQIKQLFNQKKIKVRTIVRGIVSKKRWSGRPDNLPGSIATIKRYPITIFIQMKYQNDLNEEIYKIFYFDHKLLGNEIKLVDADKRQQNKGYLKVIDIEDFEKNNNKYVFKNIEDLKLFINSF